VAAAIVPVGGEVTATVGCLAIADPALFTSAVVGEMFIRVAADPAY